MLIMLDLLCVYFMAQFGKSGAGPIYKSSCWQHEEADWGISMMFALILGCNVGLSEDLAAE